MAIVEVDELTKYYGETRGIEQLTFSVREGEVFGYLGPTGAGKTTTIRTLMGLQSPTNGEATILEYDVLRRRDCRAMKQEVGYLPSDPSFDPGTTGRTLLEHHASLKRDERTEELLDLFDPPLDRPIETYSRGEIQALAIVLAFMHDPELVFMDEPYSGLETQQQVLLSDFIRSERERQTTVFLSSSSLSDVRTLCDRVGIVRNGHLIAVEPVEALPACGGKSVRVTLAESVDTADFALDGVHDIEVIRGMSGSTYSPPTSTGDGALSDDPNQVTNDRNEASNSVDPRRRSDTTTDAKTTVQFTYTGEYDALLDCLQNYTLVDVAISNQPLESIFEQLYGKRLGTISENDV